MDLRTNLQYVYGLEYKTPSTKLEVLKVLKTEGARARTHTHTHTHTHTFAGRNAACYGRHNVSTIR